jgi:hypothetical protein
MKNRTMYRVSSLLAIMLFFTSVVFAQSRGRQGQFQDRFRQLEAQRVAYITNELSLTPEEAQKFWPVYNQYHEKRNQLVQNHRTQRRSDFNVDQLSEKELHELADADIRNMEEMIVLRREYHEKFKRVIPIKKVVLLYNAERDFNRQLLMDERGSRTGGGRFRNQ